MASEQTKGWWQTESLLPALVIVAPYFLNKLLYIAFPGWLSFVVVDYMCRAFSLGVLYFLLRRSAGHMLPISWHLAAPSVKELKLVFLGTIVLIVAYVVGNSWLGVLNDRSGYLTSYPVLPAPLQYFDGVVGMIFVGLSEEAVFRFYLMNVLLLRGWSPTGAIFGSTLIFAAIHWSYGLGAVVFAAIAGLILSIIFFLSRNLTVPVVVHAVYDAVLFAGGAAYLWQSYVSAW